jgi:hypothetical protein
MRKTGLLFLLLAAVAGGAGEKIAGGPYVVNTGPRSATVMYLVEDNQVALGSAPGQHDKTVPILRAEKIPFTGLEPGKTYYYDVNGTDAGKGSFKTAPADAADFQFVVFGDTRTRTDVHRKVIASLLKNSNPEFVLHTGDTVANGSDPSLWPVFFDIERELLRKATFFPSLGNHERNAREWYDYFNVESSYYSFNWGSSHFTVLNTDIANIGPGAELQKRFWQEQVKWLREDLEKNQNADFRFVLGHHPPMTAVSNRQGDNPHMTALMPLFTEYKVTAGFFGHDHNYQHYFKDGVHYFITGGGGAPLYDVAKPPAGITKKVASIENYMVVNVEGKTVRFEGFKPDGELLEVTEVK